MSCLVDFVETLGRTSFLSFQGIKVLLCPHSRKELLTKRELSVGKGFLQAPCGLCRTGRDVLRERMSCLTGTNVLPLRVRQSPQQVERQ